MLSKLCIKNYALIDDIEINFNKGLTVITGETGAGKSILLGALGLVLGNRVERSFFKDQSKKCSIEAWFLIKDFELKSFFKENDLDFDAETIIRREISPSGKSRIFINDSPSTLDLVQKLGKSIIDIHSQNQSVEINEDQFKFAMIDTLANNLVPLKTFQEQYAYLLKLRREIAEYSSNVEESRKQEDYLHFQFEELEKLSLRTGEEQELEEEYKLLSHAEEIIKTASFFNQLVDESEQSLLSGLSESKSLLLKLAKLNETFSELAKRFDSSIIEIQDIHLEINQKVDRISTDEGRLNLIEERLAEIHRLKLKHGFNKADDLIEHQKEIKEQLEGISLSEEGLEQLEKERGKTYEELAELSLILRKNRENAIDEFQNEIIGILVQLEIPHANFKVELSPETKLNPWGSDAIQFLFSANKGIVPKAVGLTASGGEVSRLMLALKAQLAKFLKLPTILFDEIDTGISGEAAKRMGELMKKLGQQRQVISITHLPQIASKGDNHLLVYKSDQEDKTRSQIKDLEGEERIVEVAKMLGGNKISDAARNNAEELINNN